MATLYDVSVPGVLRGLRVIPKLFDIAETHAGGNADHLLSARLAPDMLDLTGQVQRATDSAKGMVVRVADVENLSVPDDEKTCAELRARIAKVIEFIESVPAKSFNEREDTQIIFQSRSAGPQEYTGLTYVMNFALPNVYFHVTTAYDILRANGVPVGKADYLGWR